MKLSITANTSLLAFVALLSLLTLAAIGVYQINEELDAIKWVVHTHDVISELHATVAEVKDIDVYSRAYVITGDESWLKFYKRAATRLTEHLSTLRSLTADNASELKRLDALETEVAEKQRIADAVIDARRRQGIAAAATMVSSKKGEAQLQVIRVTFAAIQMEEERLLSQRSELLGQSTDRAVSAVCILLALCCAMIVWVILLVRRHVAIEEARVRERKEAERRVSAFYSAASHELRTPLTSIKASLGLMEAGLVGALSEKAQKLVRISREECDRMVRLINDMLDLRKLEAGKLEFRTAEVPAADVVSAALRATTGMAQDFGVTVKQGASEEVHVKCDLDRLSRVLTNLISNAIKFSQPGETVTVEVRRTAGKVRFEVTDMGPGISAEQTSTLFRDFVQLNTVEGRADLGTGLGLAISKGIVEEHDGAIGVNSQIGKGSTFWFELPAAT